MKYSYNWLKSLLPDIAISAQEVAETLTLHSFETEVAGTIALDPQIVTAKIVQLTPHPHADRLRLARVNTNTDQPTVVCGAPNIKVGDIVPYAPPGAKVLDATGTSSILKAAKIRGVNSPGMLASLRELGLGHDQSGIWLLPPDTKVGLSLASLIPPDIIIKADLTPNRAHDCFCHIGLARELGALLNLSVVEPTSPPLPRVPALSDRAVQIADQRLCPRYLAAYLTNLAVASSPLWLQIRLLAVGSKPINNLVDITNYVAFEYGNPTHIFDQAKLPAPNISVRLARSGESLTVLDQSAPALSENDLIISADTTPIAIAGVIGGLVSGVSSTTTTGLLEVANFNAFNVQETSRRLNLRTEASLRFSKGLEPGRVEISARRAIDLLGQFAKAQLAGIIDQHPQRQSSRTITFDPATVSAVAGLSISSQQASAALRRLRFVIDDGRVSPPPDRLDINAAHDLAEEVIRLIGLNNIPAAILPPSVPRTLPHRVYWREVIRDTLVKLGFSESYNASFEPAAYADLLGLADQPHLVIANPPAPDLANLRVSLLPGLLANIVTNRTLLHRQAGRGESALFEIGHIYLPAEADKPSAATPGSVPGVVETESLAGLIIGETISLAQVEQVLAQALSLGQVSLKSALPAIVKEKLKFRAPITAFEINLTKLIQRVEVNPGPAPDLETLRQNQPAVATFTPLPKHPPAYRDLSLLVAPHISIERVQEIIERTGGQLVIDVDLFDIYDLSPAKRSLAFHLTFQDSERTLTDTEVNKLHNNIIATLRAELEVDIRD